LLNKTIIYNLLGALLGFALGYAYWYFIGCEDGCTIRSVWWRMSLWGTVMGYLTTSIVIGFFNKKLNLK
jgi:hypothetical protein